MWKQPCIDHYIIYRKRRNSQSRKSYEQSTRRNADCTVSQLRLKHIELVQKTPKVVYLSRWGWGLNRIKNWDPFVLGPLLAIERKPGPSCFSMKFSSAEKDYLHLVKWKKKS